MNNVNNLQQNIVLPLTQASLAAVSSSSSFNMHPQGIQQNTNMSSINEESMLMRMNLLNNGNKLGSKYASSTFLNDPSVAASNAYPTFKPTRTQPRRRTPRNAEEFLVAAGVSDPASFVNKGYYVGSMLNLSEFAASHGSMPKTSVQMSEQHGQVIENANYPQHMIMPNGLHQSRNNAANSSSSSSSTMNFYKNGAALLPDSNMMAMVMMPNGMSFSNGMQRRNSIHEANSLSMANLANFPSSSPIMSNNNTMMQGTSSRTKLYAKNHMRSQTTAIHPIGGQVDSELDYSSIRNEGMASNGTSGGGSDSSASPTPSLPPPLMQSQRLSSGGSLGPLMRAVSTLSPSAKSNFFNLSQNGDSAMNSSPKLVSNTTNANNRSNSIDDEADEYDDYEYLERNLGAEPECLQKSLGQPEQSHRQNHLTNSQATTNVTHVTDYFTDESASCHNEDFSHHRLKNGANMPQFKQHDFQTSFVAAAATPSPASLNSGHVISSNGNMPNEQQLNQYVNNTNNIMHQLNGGINVQRTQLNNNMTLNRIKENNNVSNNVNGLNNLNNMLGLGGGGWDHASVTSNNSMVSGLYFSQVYNLIVEQNNHLLLVFFFCIQDLSFFRSNNHLFAH